MAFQINKIRIDRERRERGGGREREGRRGKGVIGREGKEERRGGRGR